MGIKPRLNRCHWILLPSWLTPVTALAAQDVPAKYLQLKKWWQHQDGTIVIASVAVFAANLWILLQFATALRTRFIAEFATIAYGISFRLH